VREGERGRGERGKRMEAERGGIESAVVARKRKHIPPSTVAEPGVRERWR